MAAKFSMILHVSLFISLAACNPMVTSSEQQVLEHDEVVTQRQVIATARGYAEVHEKGSTEYYSHLRAALSTIGASQVASEANTARGLKSRENTVSRTTEHISAVDQKSPVDSDPIFQRNLEALLQAATQEKEEPGSVRPRIIGGWITQGFTATVAIKNDFRTNQICSGVLLARNVVLSAAHCQCLDIRSLILVGWNLNASESSFRIDQNGTKTPVICPADSDEIDHAIRGKDFLLFFLTRPIPEGRFVSYPLATPAMIASSGWVAAVGFGQDDNEDSGTKRYVDIAIATPDCTGAVKGISRSQLYDCVAGKELVAQNKAFLKATCYGDSGGPIYVHFKGNYYLAGVTSRGLNRDCRKGGIYTLITDEVIKWLRDEGGLTLTVGTSQN